MHATNVWKSHLRTESITVAGAFFTHPQPGCSLSYFYLILVSVRNLSSTVHFRWVMQPLLASLIHLMRNYKEDKWTASPLIKSWYPSFLNKTRTSFMILTGNERRKPLLKSSSVPSDYRWQLRFVTCALISKELKPSSVLIEVYDDYNVILPCFNWLLLYSFKSCRWISKILGCFCQ